MAFLRTKKSGRWNACSAIALLLSLWAISASAAPCPTVAGYTYVAGLDYTGFDIGLSNSSSITTLATQCNQNPRCKLFTTAGYLKNGSSVGSKQCNQVDSNTCRGTFLKASVAASKSSDELSCPQEKAGTFKLQLPLPVLIGIVASAGVLTFTCFCCALRGYSRRRKNDANKESETMPKVQWIMPCGAPPPHAMAGGKVAPAPAVAPLPTSYHARHPESDRGRARAEAERHEDHQYSQRGHYTKGYPKV